MEKIMKKIMKKKKQWCYVTRWSFNVTKVKTIIKTKK